MIIRLRELKRINEFFRKLPKILAQRAFFVSLILIFLALLWGAWLFYKYNILVEKREPEILEKPLTLDEKGLQEILKIWRDRKERFDQTEFKEYNNPF